MAVDKIEGFDNFNSTSDFIAWNATGTSPFAWRGTSGTTFTAQGTGAFGFGKAISFGASDYIFGAISSTRSEELGGCHLYIPSGSYFGIGLYDSATQNPLSGGSGVQVSLLFNSINGTITAYRGGTFGSGGAVGTSLGVTAGNVFSNNTFFFAESDVLISTTSGGVVININGTNVLYLSQVNTDLAASGHLDSVIFGSLGGHSAVNCELDNLYLFSNAPQNPLGFNNFLGPMIAYTAFPLSNGSTITWTPSPNTNANWQNVDEIAMDSDTTYNSTTSYGNIDVFHMGQLPANYFAYAVVTRLAVRQGLAGIHSLCSVLDSGVGQSLGSGVMENSTYTYQDDVFATDPNGGGQWHVAAVNAIQVGYKPLS